MAAGGASNHRAGLYDAILIKENHIAAAGGIARGGGARARAAPELAGTLEVEVRDPQEIEQALAAGRAAPAARQHGRRAAARRGRPGRGPRGARGQRRRDARDAQGAWRQTGVEWISMGALTHSAPALDLSLTSGGHCHEPAHGPDPADGAPQPPSSLSPQEIAELQEEVRALAAERGAVILAHNYQVPEVQDVADYVGDSLGLSRRAAAADGETIVFCGVHFMAETASILCPRRPS